MMFTFSCARDGHYTRLDISGRQTCGTFQRAGTLLHWQWEGTRWGHGQGTCGIAYRPTSLRPHNCQPPLG